MVTDALPNHFCFAEPWTSLTARLVGIISIATQSFVQESPQKQGKGRRSVAYALVA